MSIRIKFQILGGKENSLVWRVITP